ncbi:MAG: hypothetical protein IIW86_00750 [Clostridia bacterium]|nr:hypothetical protein [Clostridia bacterium]
MNEIMVKNSTTGEGKVFDLDNESYEFCNFCRKAVLDWLYNAPESVSIELPNGKELTISADDPEPMLWFAAAILYMKCVEEDNWEGIIDFYQIITNENEDEDED